MPKNKKLGFSSPALGWTSSRTWNFVGWIFFWASKCFITGDSSSFLPPTGTLEDCGFHFWQGRVSGWHKQGMQYSGWMWRVMGSRMDCRLTFPVSITLWMILFPTSRVSEVCSFISTTKGVLVCQKLDLKGVFVCQVISLDFEWIHWL
jgi:hypothetical protein